MRRFVIALATALSVSLAAQSVPATINYQGRLTDNSPAQNPVNTTVPMAFAIWDAASAGSKLWQEPASGGTGVLVVNGIFNVALGAGGVAIPPSVFTGATSTRFLEITMNPGTPGAETLAPRQLITASGYANLAQSANSAVTATTASSVTNGVYTTGSYANPAWITGLDGGKISGTVGTGSGGTGISTAPTAAGQFLRSTGAGAWGVGAIQPGDVPAAGGATSGNFASLYLSANQTVLSNTAVTFDTTAASNGWLLTSGNTLTCLASGTYFLTFTLYSTTSNAEFALQHNGVVMGGSRARTQNGIYTTMTTLAPLLAGDQLRLIDSGLINASLSVNLVGQTAASLTVVRIQ